jgi:hypothetical protein
MESGSQTDKSPEHPPKAIANIAGTLIALLTLIIPLISIAHFSSNSTEAWRPSTYQMLHPPD